MSNVDIFSIQIDSICLITYLVIIFYLLKSKDQYKVLYVGILVLAILVVGFDIGLRFGVETKCRDIYGIGLNCGEFYKSSVFFFIGKYIFYLTLIYAISSVVYLLNPNKSIDSKKRFFIGSLPFLIAFYMILSSIFDGKILIVTYSGALIKGPYFFILVSVIGFYSIMALIHSLSIVNAKKERLEEITYYRSEYLIFYVAIALPFILSSVGFLLEYPLFVASLALTFTYLMTIHQHLRLSVDELTSINNLNELKRYLDNLMLLPEKRRRKTFLIFIDVNKFKLINDKYGHSDGDLVLIQLSRILKSVASSFNCFVCRYGGDEFILIKKYANEEKASSICKYIEYNLKLLGELSLASYEVTVSTGFTRFDRRFNSTQAFIDAADKLMYETKRYSKKNFAELLKTEKKDKTEVIGKDIFKYSHKLPIFNYINKKISKN